MNYSEIWEYNARSILKFFQLDNNDDIIPTDGNSCNSEGKRDSPHHEVDINGKDNEKKIKRQKLSNSDPSSMHLKSLPGKKKIIIIIIQQQLLSMSPNQIFIFFILSLLHDKSYSFTKFLFINYHHWFSFIFLKYF